MSHAREMSHREPSEHLSRAQAAFGGADWVGLLLTTALVGWLALAGARSEDPAALSPASLAAGAAVAFVVGRAGAARWGGRLALVVVVPAAILLAWAWPDIVDGRPMGRPLGYANATAALAVQAVAGASIVAASSHTRITRTVAAAAAAAFAAAPFVLGSIAGAVLGVVVIAVGAIGALRRWTSRSAAVAVAAFLSALVGTVALGVTYQNDGRAGVVETALTERRSALWQDALQEIGREPLFGVGIGRFDDESPVARSDPDARWAHHEFLQLSAETGLVGGLLLVALVAWAIATTGRDGGDAAHTALAAAAVAALAIHSCVDYVLRFPIVPVSAAFLLGLATIAKRTPDDATSEPLVALVNG